MVRKLKRAKHKTRGRKKVSRKRSRFAEALAQAKPWSDPRWRAECETDLPSIWDIF